MCAVVALVALAGSGHADAQQSGRGGTSSDANARALAHEFSESELRGLIAFYQSPLGRRYLDAKPRIMRALATEGGRVYADHGEELRALILKGMPKSP